MQPDKQNAGITGKMLVKLMQMQELQLASKS